MSNFNWPNFLTRILERLRVVQTNENIPRNLDPRLDKALIRKLFFESLIIDGRPSWDEYFLTLAKIVSCRSIDPSTKHGCVIVDADKRVLSLGYNSPPKGLLDDKVPLTRPEKYPWFLHAEQNAIMFCQTSLKGATAYVTGRPCSVCTRMLIQMSIGRIAYGGQTSHCTDKADIEAADKMLAMTNIKVDIFDDNMVPKAISAIS